MFGIGRELPFTMSAWSEKMGLNFPLLSDATLVVAKVRKVVRADAAGGLGRRPGLRSNSNGCDSEVTDLGPTVARV